MEMASKKNFDIITPGEKNPPRYSKIRWFPEN